LSIDCIYFFFSNLNYKVVIFLSQTENTPKHFLEKKKHYIYIHTHIYDMANCKSMFQDSFLLC
jgi:hypothetical protein